MTERERLEQKAVTAHIVCHGWLAAQGPDFVGEAPAELTNALHSAEEELQRYIERTMREKFR